MQLRQLEYFVAVARERHFARAAEKCYVSQPALSTAIGKLERELNVPLIRRGRTFQGLTPEGERIVVWAKRMLAEQDALRAEAAAVRSGICATLRLGTGPTVSTTTALPVAAFCAMHPLAKVTICSRLSAGELLRQLQDFELDAAISHFGPDDQAGLDVVPLYEERYVLLVSGEKLVPAAVDVMAWSEAAHLPLALLSLDMRFRQAVDEAFARGGAVPAPQVETDSVASLYAFAASGDWATVVPHTWLRALPATGTTRAVRLVEPDQRAQISLAIHPAERSSVAATAFRDVAAGAALFDLFDLPRPSAG